MRGTTSARERPWPMMRYRIDYRLDWALIIGPQQRGIRGFGFQEEIRNQAA
jgi:hypothetical protein